MKQSELEDKVRVLFEQQGFEVEKDGSSFIAENDQRLKLRVFSSENCSVEDVLSRVKSGEKVFVDEQLEEIKDKLDNDVSVLSREEDEKEYDTPSYEIIGDIAVINDLAEIEKSEAVEGIKHYNPDIKTILLKKEGLNGEFRVGDYEKLFGEETETIHKEHGCRYKVDPTKVYFSERFATERERVISQIKDGEKILVMFAGVGPFAIMAAKKANPEKVVAVEKNPEGAKYLKENIKLNKVEDKVEGIKGDVSRVIPELGKFDRIVMPLPESADQFLDLAFRNIDNKGVVHYYRFLEDGNWDNLIGEVEEIAQQTGRKFEISEKAICGQRAPNIDRVCIDIEVE